MNKQEHYRKKYKQLVPSWNSSPQIYKNIIDSLVNSKTKLLDIGCGHGTFLKSVHDKTPYSYGIDPDKQALDKNAFIKHKSVASVEKMPFKDNFFDVAVLTWVVEHLPNPKKSFQEIYRVLKPGGHVVFITPNVWNYNVWLIRLIPERFHEFFTTRLYGRKEHDTYPKQYKLNSVQTINKILGELNFQKEKLILNGDPSYISFNDPLFYFASFLEKIMDFKPLNFTKVHLIGVYRK